MQFAVGALYGSKIADQRQQAVTAAVLMTFNCERDLSISSKISCARVRVRD